MAVTSINTNIERSGALSDDVQPIWGELRAVTTAAIFGNSFGSIQRIGDTKILPTLPSGVTAYIPQNVSFSTSSICSVLVGKLVNLGSLTLGDGAGGASSFVDGNAMPTITELGVSRTAHSMVLAEVTTAFNATPGSFTITYVDQDGNAAEGSVSQTLTASSAVGSVGLVRLATGDVGVRDITASSRTGGTNPSGVIKFWGVVPLGFIPSVAVQQLSSKSFLANGFNVVRLGAGDQVGCFALGLTAAQAIFGAIYYIGEN